MKYLKRVFSFLLALSLSAPAVSSFAAINTAQNQICQNQNDINKQTTSTNDEVVQVFNSNNQNIYLTENDVYLMAQIVFAESKGEPFAGKVAVASVILNRVLDPHFPDTVSGVVFQPNAFSCVVDGRINVVPNSECYNAVYEAIAGNDPTNEALFFYNPEIATCSWMIEINKINTTSIGHHLFFNA